MKVPIDKLTAKFPKAAQYVRNIGLKGDRAVFTDFPDETCQDFLFSLILDLISKGKVIIDFTENPGFSDEEIQEWVEELGASESKLREIQTWLNEVK